MKRFLFILILVFFISVAAKSTANDAYYSQNESNGELYLGVYPNYFVYWTPNKIDYTYLSVTEPLLFFNSAGNTKAIGTTTTDQYVDHINLWMSGPGVQVPPLNAWYSCDYDIPNWSNDFDHTILTKTPRKVTFTFPKVDRCNLKQYSVSGFGVYAGKGGGYPMGVGYLASNANPAPGGGLWTINEGRYDFIEDYDIKAEIWTKPEIVPVLIIPGVMGTDLFKEDNKLWANLGKMLKDIGDDFMDPLQFKSDFFPTDSGIKPTEVVSNPDNLFDYTQSLINELKDQGYSEGTTSTSTLFTFPYDWRYGVSEEVVNQLKQKIQEIKQLTGAGKVDVIAHSTGGLLVKKYVLENPTEHNIGKAVFVGVPSLGSPNAIKVLLEGDSFGIPWLADGEMKKISQNLPVVYHLSPSQEYFNNAGSFFHLHNSFAQGKDEVDKDLNYSDSLQWLKDKNLINSGGQAVGENLHTQTFDNFDLRTAGVDFYNIVGCKTPTLGQVQATTKYNAPGYNFDVLGKISGDGTVPEQSALAAQADDSKTFYVIKPDHSKMLSSDGSRQQIVNIISGSSLQVGNNIKTKSEVDSNADLCKLKGKWLGLFSPVDISITDEFGNQAGLAEDGSVQNNIPGASFEIWGEHKYIFLPTDENQTYSIVLKGAGDGHFTLKISDINNDQLGSQEVYTYLPVTNSLSGKLTFSQSGESSLSLDLDNDGVTDKVIAPKVFTSALASDQIPPQTIIRFNNQTASEQNNFTEEVTVRLEPVDLPEANSSGLYKTYYSIDNESEFVDYSGEFKFGSNGEHLIKYFSVDNAGNIEPAKQADFNLAIANSEPSESTVQTVTQENKEIVNSSGGGFSYPVYIPPLTKSEPKILGASIHGEGGLIIFPNDPTVYFITNGIRRPFYSAQQFLKAGFSFANVNLAFEGDSGLMLGMPFGE